METVEKFWNDRPCNVRHSKEPIGTRKYFDQVEAKKFFVEPHIIPFSEFPKWKGKKVLEIGCGLGTMGVNFARYGADYTAVELSKESLELAKRNFEVNGLEGKFYLGNAEELSDFLPIHETYDLIYSFGVIHHSEDPRSILLEACNFMHRDSVIKAMVYAARSWKSMMIGNGHDRFEAQNGCPIAHTYTLDLVQNTLFQDFIVTDIEQTHIFPYSIPEYKDNVYIKEPWFKSMPPGMFEALEKELGWHLLINAELP